jgi:hypothetical protein
MDNNRMDIKKIPLKEFIETLLLIYNNGVELVNMIVEKGENQDAIWFVEDESEGKKDVKIEKTNFEDLL